MNSPAGSTTISGHWSHSLKVSPGLSERSWSAARGLGDDVNETCLAVSAAGPALPK